MDQAPPSELEIACAHCGATHPSAFTHCPLTGAPLGAGKALIGRVFAGRYRVLGLLGEGGMGAVYAAEHTLIGRKVALKRLHPELAKDPSAVARFQREARAAAATGHENIVEVIDMGYGEDGAPFIVMEYLRGQTLAAAIHREGAIAPERACRIVGQVLAALAAVHRHGIVHRDLKPDNVFLTKRGGDGDYVKVLDFGISKVHRDDSEPLALTRTGVMLGTPYYMSPEQARGAKTLDHRVDLYAAGAILYEALTGRVPFDAPNYHALLQEIVACQPVPVRDLAKDVSAELASIVHKAIGPDQEQRCQTAREMLLELVAHGAVDPGVEEPETASIVTDPDAALPGEAGELKATAPLDPGAMAERARELIGAPQTTDDVATASTVALSTPMSEKKTARLPQPAPTPGTRPRRTRSGPPRAPTPTQAAATPSPRQPPTRVRSGAQGGPRAYGAQSMDWTDDARAGRRSRLLDPFRSTGREPSGSITTGPGASVPSATDASTPSRPASGGREPTGRILTSGREPSGVVITHGTPRPRTPPGAPATGSAVKGSLVLGAMQSLEETRGAAAVERVLAMMPDAARARLSGMILPVSWIALTDYDALLDAMERAYGSGNGAIAFGTGAATAERDLQSTHKALMESLAPVAALERLPQVWRAYHDDGSVTVEPSGTGAWRIDVRDLAHDTFLHAMAMTGFVKRMLELCGARDVRATLLACRGRGDDRTTIAIRLR